LSTPYWKPGHIGTEWGKAQQEAFEALIKRFTSEPVLRYYDPTKRLRLETDASQFALAGILSQQFDDGWHPIAYHSQKFKGAEIHYPVYDKELMAIVASFSHWRHYLEGTTDIEVYRS
jgi:hypothetical protein